MAGTRRTAKKFFSWAAGGAAVVTILNWAGLHPHRETSSEIKQSGAGSVASQNQSGGITASQVVINNTTKPPRKLNDNLRRDLLTKLKECEAKKVTVETVMGDREAIDFAKETSEFLDKNGFATGGFGQGMYKIPPRGQDVFCKGEGTAEVVIGIRN